MTKILGDSTIGVEALQQMRGRGGKWAAYQSMDMSSVTLGDLRFLQFGDANNTFAMPPRTYPDSQHGIGWRFQYVGLVDLEAGKIVEAQS